MIDRGVESRAFGRIGIVGIFLDLLTMRVLIVAAAALILAAPAALADFVRPSQVACDAKKIGAKELADCLRVAADHSDKELAATIDAAIKTLEARQGLLSAQKARWKRSLNESQALWINWRDTECQDVAPFEAGLGAKGADPRLACIIDHDAQRSEEIKGRYP
jgi:uncharacterized protein YecT (DUF1311 family)